MVDLVGPGSATHRAKNLNLINEEQQKYVVIPTEPEGGLPWVSFASPIWGVTSPWESVS
jgi:hypothetical protein